MTPSPDETKNTILGAAAVLFVENGYHGTSMRQIAHKANIALGGIYNHFEGKEELFTAILLEHHPLNQLVPLLSHAEGQTVEDLLYDGARRLVTSTRRNPYLINLIFIEQVEFNGRHVPQLFDQLFPPALAFTQRLAKLPGSLRPIPPITIMRTFFGLLFSHLVLELLLSNTSLGQQPWDTDDLVDVVLHGILKNNSETTHQEQPCNPSA